MIDYTRDHLCSPNDAYNQKRSSLFYLKLMIEIVSNISVVVASHARSYDGTTNSHPPFKRMLWNTYNDTTDANEMLKSSDCLQ